MVQEAGWAAGQIWIGVENFVLTGIQTPDHPASSESLYQLSYRGSTQNFLCVEWKETAANEKRVEIWKELAKTFWKVLSWGIYWDNQICAFLNDTVRSSNHGT
jgi:hypothetical protein